MKSLSRIDSPLLSFSSSSLDTLKERADVSSTGAIVIGLVSSCKRHRVDEFAGGFMADGGILAREASPRRGDSAISRARISQFAALSVRLSHRRRSSLEFSLSFLGPRRPTSPTLLPAFTRERVARGRAIWILRTSIRATADISDPSITYLSGIRAVFRDRTIGHRIKGTRILFCRQRASR